MTKTTMRLGAALLLGAALTAGGALTAQAAPASTTTAAPSTVAHWSVPSTKAASATAYWTPDRMRAAVPATAPAGEHPATTAPAKGAPVTKAAVAPKAAAVATVSHIGKVFFTLGGTDYVCSGNSVASGNGSVVSTAGHCVNEGPGDFATNWVFVPAYDNGSAPYGQWTATDLYTTSQWKNDGDITYDTGFAVVSGSGTLADEVGASGVAFNQDRGLSYTLYGYPAAPPFDGETLQSCSGTASDDPFGQSESQGVSCDMTGGSSGGPWFIGSGAGGTQNSINSFGYDSVSNTMFGPYWGSAIEAAYDAASAA
jgi:hypothetical protein